MASLCRDAPPRTLGCLTIHISSRPSGSGGERLGDPGLAGCSSDLCSPLSLPTAQHRGHLGAGDRRGLLLLGHGVLQE